MICQGPGCNSSYESQQVIVNKGCKNFLSISCYSLFLLIFLAIGCFALWAETKQKIVGADKKQDNWFLLPVSHLKGHKKLSKLYLDLFAAPSLDLEAIFSFAEEYEKEVRHWLGQQKYNLNHELCALGQSELKRQLKYLKEEKDRQLLLWRNVHRNYTHSVQNYLKQRQARAKLEPSLLKLIQSNFKELREMQDQRQKQIGDAWTLLFRNWEKQSRASSLHKESCTVQSLRNFKELSETELIRPYYLSLYRFLRLFPARERGPFLFRMHRL